MPAHATRMSNCTNRSSSTCSSDGKCGNQLRQPGDDKIALVRLNRPRHTLQQRPTRSDEQQPNTLVVLKAMVALARIGVVTRDRYKPTSLRSCLSRLPDAAVAVVVVVACLSVKRMTAESSPSDNRPCNRWR